MSGSAAGSAVRLCLTAATAKPLPAATRRTLVRRGKTLTSKQRSPVYGLMIEFEKPDELIEAARRVRDAGYKRIEAYSPFPVEGLTEALGFHRSHVPLIVLIGGIIGCVGGYLLQYYVAVIDYPNNIGGRPLNSWPSFIPITFELTVLIAALFAVLGMLALNG